MLSQKKPAITSTGRTTHPPTPLPKTVRRVNDGYTSIFDRRVPLRWGDGRQSWNREYFAWIVEGMVDSTPYLVVELFAFFWLMSVERGRCLCVLCVCLFWLCGRRKDQPTLRLQQPIPLSLLNNNNTTTTTTMMQSTHFLRRVATTTSSIVARRSLSSDAAAAASTGMTLNFNLPTETIYADAKVDQVIVPGAEGEFGVTADHVPVVAQLKPGVLQILHSGSSDPEKYFVAGGFSITHDNSVTVRLLLLLLLLLIGFF